MTKLMKIEFYERPGPYGEPKKYIRPLGLYIPRVFEAQELFDRGIPVEYTGDLIMPKIFQFCYADAFAEQVDPDTTFMLI